jgi:hypothetical protein
MGIETPDNGAYMVAAYLVVCVVVLGYGVSLWKRSKR